MYVFSFKEHSYLFSLCLCLLLTFHFGLKVSHRSEKLFCNNSAKLYIFLHLLSYNNMKINAGGVKQGLIKHLLLQIHDLFLLLRLLLLRHLY